MSNNLFRTPALRDLAFEAFKFEGAAGNLTAKLVALKLEWESGKPEDKALIEEARRAFYEGAYVSRVLRKMISGDIAKTGDNVLTDVFTKAREFLQLSGHTTKGDGPKRTKEQEDLYNAIKSSWNTVARRAGKVAKKRSRHATAGVAQSAATHTDGTPTGSNKLDAPLSVPAIVNSEAEVMSFALNVADMIERFERTATQAKVPTGDAGMYMRDFVSKVRSMVKKEETTQEAPPVVATPAPSKRRNVKSK